MRENLDGAWIVRGHAPFSSVGFPMHTERLRQRRFRTRPRAVDSGATPLPSQQRALHPTCLRRTSLSRPRSAGNQADGPGNDGACGCRLAARRDGAAVSFDCARHHSRAALERDEARHFAAQDVRSEHLARRPLGLGGVRRDTRWRTTAADDDERPMPGVGVGLPAEGCGISHRAKC
jgi:hypothetical protein